MNSLTNDIFKVNIYINADCAVKVFGSIRRLIKAGIMKDARDFDSVTEEYEEIVIDYISDKMPDGWELTRDYWGAKCFAYKPSFHAPKHNTYFAGCSHGRIMFFETYESMEKYVSEVLNRIEDKEDFEREIG